MATNLDAVLSGKVDDRIGLLESVFVWRWPQFEPLELAFRYDHLAIGNDCIAIGWIGSQGVGPHRRAIWNEICSACRRLRGCRKCGHAGQFTCAENGQRRG